MISKLLESVFFGLRARYAVIDEDNSFVRILVEPENKEYFYDALKTNGWTETQNHNSEIFLYGMEHFKSYIKDNIEVIVCCQLACKSTLHGEWVPLDRKINSSVLKNAVGSKYGMVVLESEDMFCYLLGKCVYTEKNFSTNDISRILKLKKMTDKSRLMPKLESVFFKFSDKMLEMINNNEYSSIIDSLWSYSDY